MCPPTIAALPAGTYLRTRFESHWTWDLNGNVLEQLLPSPEAQRALSWLECVGASYDEYQHLRVEGVPPEDARSVLPNATKTDVMTTFDLRQWKHVFEERALNKHAQWQIREILGGVLKEFAKLLPCVFADQMAMLDKMNEDPDRL